MKIEQRLAALGIVLPDFGPRSYYGATYGKMKPYHLHGDVLHLSGHIPLVDGEVRYPGRLGATLTLEEGYAAARLTGVNVLGAMKQALGDLDRVAGLIKCLNFVVCEPDYYEVHRVASGLTDLLAEVLGDDIGIGCRATIGVQALADNACFETWVEVEVRRGGAAG
jgi:enamine deaminase RidA (YjgF/YER057c/UK114 family)